MGGKKTVENSRRFEKDRRDKLNVAFLELCKLLPDHDPSITLSKMEILRKAAEYIKYLQVQNDEIMKLGEDMALKNESEKLRKRVAHLLLKTKELVDALRCAGVPIPTSKRKKRKPKNAGQDASQINQNKASSGTQEEAKTSKGEATGIKKVKCGCMKSSPEKKPLKESNMPVTASHLITLGNCIPVAGNSPVSSLTWTSNTKLLTVTPTPLISASAMTSKVQNLPTAKKLLPGCKNISTVSTSGSTLLSPKLKNSGECNNGKKNLSAIRNGFSNVPIVPPNVQTIPIINNGLLSQKIVKEVTPVAINKKPASIVTTTSSNSITTQSIVNSTHLISLSQSSIISAPGIQTVPVLEKNILSNLGPGTLILADGRIMNVPPIVPQILVKQPQTVILMPSAKKKEKIIIPKKRDVTMTTFANKAPIPAIQAFRMESCPKVRPKKKPRVALKKIEKSKNQEKGIDDSEQVKKKIKLNDDSSPKENENKKASSNTQLTGKDFSITTNDHNCINKSDSIDDANRITESISSIPHEQEIISSSSVSKTTNEIGVVEAQHNFSPPSTAISLSSPAVTISNSPSTSVCISSSSVTTISSQNCNMSNLSDPISISTGVPEAYSNMTSENSILSSSISSSLNMTNKELTHLNSELSRKSEEAEKSSSQPTTSKGDGIVVSEIDGSSLNKDSPRMLLELSSTRVENSIALTCPSIINGLKNNALSVISNMPQGNTSSECQTTLGKTLPDQCTISNPVYSESNIVYSNANLTRLEIFPQSSSPTNTSSFVGTSSKSVENKLNSSLYGEQLLYSSIDLNREKSLNSCFQEQDGLTSLHTESEQTLPIQKSSVRSTDKGGTIVDTLHSERDPLGKQRGESLVSIDIAPTKTMTVNPIMNEKKFPNQKLMNPELPELGSSFAESSSIFPQNSEMSQSKIMHPQASAFQHENCVNSSMSSRSTAGANHILPMRDTNCNQQQDSVSQLNHSQLNQGNLADQLRPSQTSQLVEPFYTNPQRQDTLCSQSNDKLVNSKANGSFTNHPTYCMSGTVVTDKTNICYSSSLTKPASFNASEKSTLAATKNQAGNSDSHPYPVYCAANWYPTATVTYSQNSTSKLTKKSSDALVDSGSKKNSSYTFHEPISSVRPNVKEFSSQNMAFQDEIPSKPNWEKTNCGKAFYNCASSHLQVDSGTKDKNSSFQFDKMTISGKQNESHIHNQLTYLGFQSETDASHTSNFFQNFQPPSTAPQTGCNFNEMPSIVGNHSSSVSSKVINHNDNNLNANPTMLQRNSLDKRFNNPHNVNTKNSIDNDTPKNVVPFYPPTSQSTTLQRLEYTRSCPVSLPSVLSNSIDINSSLKSKQTSENSCLPRNSFSSEQNPSNPESHKALSSNTSTASKQQVNANHGMYNNQMRTTNIQNPNTITRDERRTMNDNQNSYLQGKDSSNTKKNNQITQSSCHLPETVKTSTLYSVAITEKENNSVNISSVSSKIVGSALETLTNREKCDYSYISNSPSTGRKKLQNNSEMNEPSNKINNSVENTSQSNYKNYPAITKNNEKKSQGNLLMSSSSQKSVSTEMSTDDFQSFNFNENNYPKTSQAQNDLFPPNSMMVTGASVRVPNYTNYEHIPFVPINNQYNNEHTSTRNISVCSNQNVNQALQLAPPTKNGSEQIAHQSINKTPVVSAASNPLSQKQNHISKIGPTTSDGASFKGDLNADFLKSKDLERSTFIPIIDDVRLTSDFSSDLFSSLQVPTGGQHSESISPTAAFLLAFPLVSTSRNIESLPDNENHDNQTSTPTTILQIGNIEPPSTEIFHSIEFQKNNKGNDHYEINNDYIHVNEIQNKQHLSYNKTCEKGKNAFSDYNKDQRGADAKSKSKSTSGTNGYNTQSYSYPHFPYNDYGQYCEKEGGNNQWQQEFSNVTKEQKKTCEKKKDKGVQKGCFYQNYQEYYNYKEKKRKQQNRISVNWMTTPENREQTEYQPKESEISNNYAGNSSQPAYSTIPIEFPTESFSDFCSSKKTNSYSWSPSKSLLPSLDNHLMIPSTLPTLVGDLALGTSTPSESYKAFDTAKVLPAQGQQISKKPPEKDDNKKRNEFTNKSQANFFSVSQLVDPKSKKQKTTDKNCKRQDKSSKTRGNLNYVKRKDDHCMYYEERNNFVPSQSQSQCPEKRHAYKGGSYSAESLIGAQQNDMDFSTNFNYQQNSNFFQSDFTSHIDSGQQYGYFQQTHFSGFSHDEFQDFGFGTNQRSLDQNRTKISGRKEDNYQENSVIQPQIYPSYSKSIHYNLPSSQINTNTTTTLTNFNLSTIFPEMNDQRVAPPRQTAQQMNLSFSSSQAYRGHLQQ